MAFNYNKLRGLIKEKVGTQARFAELIGISGTALYDRLANRTPFSQTEMFKSIEVLDVPIEMLDEIFFTCEIRKTE